jgi:hypothetical protein
VLEGGGSPLGLPAGNHNFRQLRGLIPVLWNRIGFNAYPDPGGQTNADLDPGGILRHKKINFYKNIVKIGNRSKTYLRRYKNVF